MVYMRKIYTNEEVNIYHVQGNTYLVEEYDFEMYLDLEQVLMAYPEVELYL